MYQPVSHSTYKAVAEVAHFSAAALIVNVLSVHGMMACALAGMVAYAWTKELAWDWRRGEDSLEFAALDALMYTAGALVGAILSLWR